MQFKELQKISELIYSYAGIHLSTDKKALVENRIGKRLEALHIADVGEYFGYLDTNPSEKEAFVNALTTNLTDFYREPHHFDKLGDHITNAPYNQQHFRIWSAGCSTGKEPYSVVCSLLHRNPFLAKKDFKILATDIDTNVLKSAKQGRYNFSEVKKVPRSMLERFFEKIPDGYAVLPEYKRFISFKQLNIHDQWPIAGQFDAIFFRNVSIYFKEEDHKKIFTRFANVTKPGGLLFLGHSEIMHNIPQFEYVGNTTYKRI